MKDIFNFAYIPNPEQAISDLANLAQDENWNYKNTNSEYDRPILRSYLNYMFKRLQEEEKVVELEKQACFNTGLATEKQREIFMLFKLNNSPDKQKWKFDFFCDENSQKLRDFQLLPQLASYFDEDPTKLIYDTRLNEPRINYNHIIDNPENRNRFPLRYQAMSDDELLTFLEGAVKLAIRRVRRNYKTAVPQFFWDKNAEFGELQLLLPLCIGDRSAADVALVITRTNNVYSGETILTLDMAYNNARLLARPDTEWLIP